jgi:hypothetical protein
MYATRLAFANNDNYVYVPEAVAIIDPPPLGFSVDVFCIASEAYLIAA